MFKKFIHRPVLAIVTSLTLVFTGLLAYRQLPISQFPEIAPTTENVKATMIGPIEFGNKWRLMM